MIIYFLFYLFNSHYQGFFKITFFGVDLEVEKHISRVKVLAFYLKEYSYAILLLLNL
jgi:hypothetical protein